MPLSQLTAIKVVGSLPSPLTADTIYYLRVGTGYACYVTNSTGTIVAYRANYANGDLNGDFTSSAINLSNENTTFARPSAGQVVIGSQRQVGRRVQPAWRNEDGGVYLAQADLFLTQYWYFLAPGSGLAPVFMGMTFLSSGLVATNIGYTSGNPFTAKSRCRLQTAATAGSVAYYIMGGTKYLYLSTLDINSIKQPSGFFWQTSICTENNVAAARFFFGLSTAVNAPTNVEPSSLLNCVGFIKRATDNNLCFYSAGAGVGPVIDLGASFDLYEEGLGILAEFELTLYNPKASTEIYWSVRNKETGVVTKGVVAAANRPVNQSFLAVRGWLTNNATAAVASVGTLGACGGNPA